MFQDTSSSHFLAFKELTNQVLMPMTSYISMPVVLQKVMQDQTYSSGKFGEVKGMVLGMLDNYNYEMTLLETTTNLLGADLHGQYYQQKKILNKAYSPLVNTCELCSRDFTSIKKGKEMVLFHCRHAYHQSCLEGTVGFDEEFTCIKCNKNSVIHTAGYRHTSSRTEPPASPRRKDKKSEVPKVHLTEHQEIALNVLWDQDKKVSKFTALSDSRREPNRYALNSRVVRNRRLTSTGEKFALRLAPPLKNGML